MNSRTRQIKNQSVSIKIVINKSDYKYTQNIFYKLTTTASFSGQQALLVEYQLLYFALNPETIYCT